MPPIEGSARVFHHANMFGVEVEGAGAVAVFESCSEIGSESEVIEQREGGSTIPVDEQPGNTTWPEVTLMAGKTNNTYLHDWRNEVVNASDDTSLPDDKYKKNVRLVQKNRSKKEIGHWRLEEAWPRAYKEGTWDANASAFVKVTLVLKFRKATWVPKAA